MDCHKDSLLTIGYTPDIIAIMNSRKESERSQHLTRKQRRALERDQRNEDVVQNPSRRRFIIGGLSALVAATLGVGIYQRKQNDQSKQIPEIDARIKEYLDKEKAIDPLIAEFESGFGNFSQKAVKLLSQSETPPETIEILQKPFDVFKINQKNSFRNVYLWRRQDLERSGSLADKEVAVEDPNFYFYDFQEIDKDHAAAFIPATRTMRLSRLYDPDNILDNLIAMHELVHVAQDNYDRATLQSNIYYAFQRKLPDAKPKMVGIYEATAFIEEIYMLNLFMGDQFRLDVMSKSGQIDIDKYVLLLNARSDQRPIIDFLGRVAFQLYSGQSSVQQIDARFLEYINRLHKQQGIDVYDRTPSGFVLVP